MSLDLPEYSLDAVERDWARNHDMPPALRRGWIETQEQVLWLVAEARRIDASARAAERARIAAAIRRLGETPQIDGALVLPLHPIVLDFIEAAARVAETAPDVYEVAEQRIAAPDRSFIPAEDVIIETAPGKCPHGVDPDWCDACFDVAIAQPAPEEPLMTGELVTACAPSGCSCAGHHMPGVRHIVPCCDKPHIDQNDHIALLDGLLTAPEEDR